MICKGVPCNFENDVLTYLLTPWSRVLLGKLTGLQLVKKFPAFYWTRRFITILTSSRHLSLSWASSIQTTHPHPTFRRSILILSFRLPLGLPSGLVPHQNPVPTSPLSHTRYMPRPSHSSWFYHPHYIGWGVQIIQLLIMYFSPFPCYLVHLRPKYSPQHPILKQPQPTFLP